jgi:hypothetical protein
MLRNIFTILPSERRLVFHCSLKTRGPQPLTALSLGITNIVFWASVATTLSHTKPVNAPIWGIPVDHETLHSR